MKGHPSRTHARVKTRSKTINGILIRKCEIDQPRSQVILNFTDNTHYEFYCSHDDIRLTGVRYGNIKTDQGYVYNHGEIVFDETTIITKGLCNE